MAGYNPNYFNRNLIESMKRNIIHSLITEEQRKYRETVQNSQGVNINMPSSESGAKYEEGGDFFKKNFEAAKSRGGLGKSSTRKGEPKGLLGMRGAAEENEAEFAERMYNEHKRQLETFKRTVGSGRGLLSPKDAKPTNPDYIEAQRRLDELEKAYAAYKTPKPAAPAAPAAPGPKFVPGKPMPWQTQQTQEPTTSPQPPAGSKVVISTSKDREGKDVTNVGVTPPESERQRQMADPRLQAAIPEPSKWGSGQYMPTGKELEPQDIRPPAKPEEQVPEPRQASGAKPEKMPETDAEFVGPPDWMSQIPSPGTKGAEKAAQRQPGAGMGAPRTSPSFSETLKGMFR